MASMIRGRGPRTRGGIRSGMKLDNVSSRYARTDCDMFSCLSDHALSQDGDDQSDSSDMDFDEMHNFDKATPGWQEARHKKKRKLNSSGGGGPQLLHSDTEDDLPPDYQTLPTDQKLNLILSKISVNDNRFRRVEKMLENLGDHHNRLTKIESVVRSYEDRIRLLEYKSIDLEARSRRNNIIFHGLKESRSENCNDIICQFVYDQFQISINDANITRAHRLGRFDPNKTRPVIVAFQEYSLTDRIIKQGHLLKDTLFSISRDYPIEITRARKTLWPEYKQIKGQNPYAKVAVVYPAKIIVNGHVVKDLFPEWDTLLRGSRIDLKHPSQSSYARKTGSTIEVTSALQSTPVTHALPVDQQSRDNSETSTTTEVRMDHVISQECPAATPGTSLNSQLGVVGGAEISADQNRDVFKTPVPSQRGRSVERTEKSGKGSRAISRSLVRTRSVSVSRGPGKSVESQGSTRTDDTP